MYSSIKKTLLVSTLVSITILSCSKTSPACGEKVDCSTVTYSGTIKPLIEDKCSLSGCHSSSWNTYSGILTIVNNGELYDQVVATENMPQSGSMSCEQRADVECWINAGAPNN